MEYNGVTMKRITLLPGFLLTVLLAACMTQTAPEPLPPLPTTASPTPTIFAEEHPCAYTWATQPLPDLSEKIQGLIEDADLNGVTVRAEAFGENCYDSQANKVVGFAAMETDFRFVVQVEDLSDITHMGETAARLLKILATIPPDEKAGPASGYVGITFESAKGQVNLWFVFDNGISALERGLTGSDLFEELLKK